MAGWHHGLDGCESEWTLGDGDGQGGLACCDSWGRKESDRTERLNWTELNWTELSYLIRQKDFADVIKVRILRWGDYPWLSGWVHIHTRVLISERGRHKGQGMRDDDRSRGWSDLMARRGPQSKECRWPLKAGKSKEWILPLSLQKKHSSADILTLTPKDQFQTSDLQNYKIINLCCFKFPLPLKKNKNKTQEDCKTWESVHGALWHEKFRVYVGYDGSYEIYSSG